jgi:hypothetical protein
MWTWKPLAFTDAGLPAFDSNGGLWIELTICGVTRYGYGEPQGRDKFDMTKGAIGNAIRNAAMRFGVALDLWAKEAPGETKPATKANKEFSTAGHRMVERMANAGSLIELAEVVPLIQSGEFTDEEKRTLRVCFDKKKVELSA